MRQNALKPKGLSLSEAQSISNQCYQKSLEITRQIENISNYQKTIEISGRDQIIQAGTGIPNNIKELILLKGKLSAVQGFLMENIKAKDLMIKDIQNAKYIATLEEPERPEYLIPDKLKSVEEEWGWEQLTLSELAKFYEADSYAAHIGQFIHKNSKLATLREELPKLPSIEWMELEAGKKTPVFLRIHNTSEELLSIHEMFAELHRNYENQVNYFKAKVKNLVTNENARIAKVNGEEIARVNQINSQLREAYTSEYKNFSEKYEKLSNSFEKERQFKIKEASALKIEVYPIFQDIIDQFLINKEK